MSISFFLSDQRIPSGHQGEVGHLRRRDLAARRIRRYLDPRARPLLRRIGRKVGRQVRGRRRRVRQGRIPRDGSMRQGHFRVS